MIPICSVYCVLRKQDECEPFLEVIFDTKEKAEAYINKWAREADFTIELYEVL